MSRLVPDAKGDHASRIFGPHHQVASSSTPEEVEDDADVAPIVPMSPIPTVSKNRRTSRGTRLRMRANVQGLEEGDSDVDIEIVDFADGEDCSHQCPMLLNFFLSEITMLNFPQFFKSLKSLLKQIIHQKKQLNC